MEFVSKTGQIDKLSTPCLILPVYSKGKQLDIVNQFDKTISKQITAVLKQGDASGKAGNTLLLQMPSDHKTKRVLLVGLGEQGKTQPEEFKKASRTTINAIKALPIKSICSALLTADVAGKDDAWKVRQLVLTSREVLYQYNETLTTSAPDANVLEKCQLLVPDTNSAKNISTQISTASSIANGIDEAKTLSNLPGNICTPTYLADTAKKLGKTHASLKLSLIHISEPTRPY